MGKPYDHNYFFAGDMSSKGSMLCCHCNQPIFNHSQDWMSYKKSKSGDWAFYCFDIELVEAAADAVGVDLADFY